MNAGKRPSNYSFFFCSLQVRVREGLLACDFLFSYFFLLEQPGCGETFSDKKLGWDERSANSVSSASSGGGDEMRVLDSSNIS